MADLFDAMHDENRARLRAAGWTRKDCDSPLREPAEEVWEDTLGNRFSLGGAVAELDRREGRRP